MAANDGATERGQAQKVLCLAVVLNVPAAFEEMMILRFFRHGERTWVVSNWVLKRKSQPRQEGWVADRESAAGCARETETLAGIRSRTK
jgi:hypothetical protein